MTRLRLHGASASELPQLCESARTGPPAAAAEVRSVRGHPPWTSTAREASWRSKAGVLRAAGRG